MRLIFRLFIFFSVLIISRGSKTHIRYVDKLPNELKKTDLLKEQNFRGEVSLSSRIKTQAATTYVLNCLNNGKYMSPGQTLVSVSGNYTFSFTEVTSTTFS
jgi:hypothetical protein